jgi:hypothetical protein
MRPRAQSWIVLAFATLPFVVAGFETPTPGLQTRSASHVDAPPLQALKGVDELKTWFNANRAHARLVLLLSPT